MLPLFFCKAFIRSDMKSCSPLPPPPGGPGFSFLFGGAGGLLTPTGGGFGASGAGAGGGGGGGGNWEPASPANDGGGGGTKSGGPSLKSGGGGGSSSSSRGGGGGGGGRESSGRAGKPPLGPLALGTVAGLPQTSEDRRTGGGGGRLDLGSWWALGAPGSWLPRAGFLSFNRATTAWHFHWKERSASRGVGGAAIAQARRPQAVHQLAPPNGP